MNDPSPDDPRSKESAVRALYFELLDCWNRRDAPAVAALYAQRASVVGFDGSQLNGRGEIEALHRRVFGDHVTAKYVGIVQELRLLAPDLILLRAVAGMVPPGSDDIKPELNAVQTLLARETPSRWEIELFHNTPAAFHGRPEAVAELTHELRMALRAR